MRYCGVGYVSLGMVPPKWAIRAKSRGKYKIQPQTMT